MVYKLDYVLDNEDCTTIVYDSELYQIVLLIKDNESFKIKKIEVIPCYQDYDILIERLKKDYLPKDLVLGKKESGLECLDKEIYPLAFEWK